MGLRDFVSYYLGGRTSAKQVDDGRNETTHESTSNHLPGSPTGQGADFDRLKRQMEEMRLELESSRSELSGLRADKATLDKHVREDEEQQRAMRQELERKNQASAQLGGRVRVLEDQIRAHEADVQRSKEDAEKHHRALAEHQRAHDTLKNEHTQTVALLDGRAAELKVVQTFLATTDSVSGKEAVQKVQDLNSEIHQVAALIADSFKYVADRLEPGQHAETAREWAEHALGRPMSQLLQATDDPTIVQVAFQGTMSMYAHWAARCWYFDLSRESEVIGDIYDDVYYHMRETETVAVARRWRALTRKHIQSVVHGETDVPANLVPRIAERLTDILLVAGCKTPLKQITEAMKTKFIEKIKNIVALALGINKTIGQDVLSCDFEITWVSPEEAFDASWMNDIDSDHAEQKKDGEDLMRVLSTTELGLGRMEKVMGDAGAEEWKDTVILKPKVVLESMVEWDGQNA